MPAPPGDLLQADCQQLGAGHRNVEVGKVYLSSAISKEDVVTAALARLEHDRGLARWEDAADLNELELATDKAILTVGQGGTYELQGPDRPSR